MRLTLITGMSGTGKTSVLGELQARGFETVETDLGEWCEWGALPGETDEGWLWREGPMRKLLERPRTEPLFVSGCVSNQGRFYVLFDHVVLLSAPADMLLARIRARTNNGYGQTEAQEAEILGYLETVEPLLRRGAHVELDSGWLTVAQMADALAKLNIG